MIGHLQFKAKKRTDCIYINLRKAFDSVVHSKLISKLTSYGLQGEVLQWLSEFLCDREQFVYLNGVSSASIPLISGVPQGSVLGPVLFLLYINDVVDCVKESVTIRLFADDAKIYFSRNDNDASKMFDTLKSFEEWADAWQLSIASDKCSVLSFGERYAPSVDYDLCEQRLTAVSNVKDLGIIMSSNMKFTEHCARISQKAYSRSVCILKCFVHPNPLLLVTCESL